MKYVIVNGEIQKTEEVNLTSFFWNDPLLITEIVWFGFGGIPLLNEKTAQIILQLQNLSANIPALFLNQREFFRRIKRMLNKNRFYRTGLINIQLLISETETNFVLFPTPYSEVEFNYHKKGVLMNFAAIQKQSEKIFQAETNQARLLHYLANQKNKNTQIQHLVFLNEKEMVCDAGIANIYFIKKKILFTPSVETGCIADNLRMPVLEASKNIGLEIKESAEIIPESIYSMDEIFFTAEATGFYWVLGINNKRFVHSVSIQIHEELNHILKSKAQ